MSSRTSPTLRRRILAGKLKELRIAAGVNRKQAAEHVGVNDSTITRIEAMTGKATVAVVSSLLDLYGVTDADERQFLTQLARDASKRDWYQSYKSAIPPWAETLFSMEAEVEEMRGYYPELVPGLLQTPDYYRACLQTSPVKSDEVEIERKVEFRIARQRRLLDARGPRFWIVLNEVVLRRQVGGSTVMREQLQHIHDQCRDHSSGITLQILPFSAGAHPAMAGGFLVLEFPERSHPDVVYLESPTDGRYLEDGAVVDRYNLVFNHLRAQSMSPGESLSLLVQAIEAS